MLGLHDANNLGSIVLYIPESSSVFFSALVLFRTPTEPSAQLNRVLLATGTSTIKPTIRIRGCMFDVCLIFLYFGWNPVIHFLVTILVVLSWWLTVIISGFVYSIYFGRIERIEKSFQTYIHTYIHTSKPR